MKRIYKSCVAVLLLLAMLLSCVPALAAGSSHSYTTLQKAEALKTLGLFQGTNKGFELEKTLTREQAITLIVRLLGAEAEAKEKNPVQSFTDVLAWASPYVGYPNFAGSAVYMDDGLSGATITGNIFGPGASGNYIEAIKINCGHDNVITNIIAVKSKATISKPDAK